jgi:hypothetical protein
MHLLAYRLASRLTTPFTHGRPKIPLTDGHVLYVVERKALVNGGYQIVFPVYMNEVN